MTTKNLCLIASLCGVTLLLGGCVSCPVQDHGYHEQYKKEKHHKKYKAEPVIFQQTYTDSDVHHVKANMYTRSVRGGESEMGYIKFKETDDGLKMWVDLIDLRPGKIYTAHVYQCWSCNNDICCNTDAMSIDLPTISIDNTGRLQQSYIVRGLTAKQLNNAKLVLTRDGGYKAAWGTLKQ